MTRFAIALGSNEGARAAHLREAVGELRRRGAIVAISPLYETAPIGGPAQEPFLNAVVVLDSDLHPAGLLDRLHEIEEAHGRVRDVHWGPRTLDLDIVAMDGPRMDTPELQIPHPRAGARRFVIDPLSEVWPEALVGDGLSASAAKELVSDQVVVLVATKWLEGESEPAGDRVE